MKFIEGMTRHSLVFNKRKEEAREREREREKETERQ